MLRMAIPTREWRKRMLEKQEPKGPYIILIKERHGYIVHKHVYQMRYAIRD